MSAEILNRDKKESVSPQNSKSFVKVAFFAYPTAFQSPGGGEVQLLKTKEYLEKEGIEIKLFDQWHDRLEDFDIFHTFGSVKDCLEIIRTADILGVKTVLSTICWYSWKSTWGIHASWDEKFGLISRQFAKNYFPIMPSKRKSMMEYSDLLFPNSQTEADQLVRYFCVPREKIFVIPNGVDPFFADAKPELFIEKYGLKNFILCVGRIEPRKNQLNMIRALKDVAMPVVFIGDYVHRYQDYYQACRREAGANTHFLGAIGHDSPLLASAFAACNTFLLASWLETPGLAALEAALAGAKIVITDQGATREYFKDFAAYVSPNDPNDIRSKTLKIFEQAPDLKLKSHIQSNYLWSHTAQKTLEGYSQLIKFHPGVRSLKIRSPHKPTYRIGVDLQSIRGKKTGLGVYTEHLISAFYENPPEGFNFRFYSKDNNKDLNTLQRWMWENIEVPFHAAHDKVDLLHIPAFSPPYVKSCKLVVTVHDLIGMLFPNQLSWPSAFYWGKWLPFSLKRADAIIADSENTKKDLIQGLGIAENKIHVIYLSGHEGFYPNIPADEIKKIKRNYGILEKYFLFVGTIEPRKNLDRVMEAFAIFLKENKESRYQLVVVGSKEFGHGKFFQTISSKVGVTLEDIVFTGYVSHEDLNALYCGAESFVYPSLYEGFGIPILEAMASGVPVIASTKTSIPEVAGDGALLVDPYQTQEISKAMSRIIQDKSLKNKLIAKGFERIKRFSWKKTAHQTAEVYRSIL